MKGSSSNGKTDQPKEDVKTDEKTEEEIDEKEGFLAKSKGALGSGCRREPGIPL